MSDQVKNIDNTFPNGFFPEFFNYRDGIKKRGSAIM